MGIEYWKGLRRVFKAGFLRSRKGGAGLGYWKSLRGSGLCRCLRFVGVWLVVGYACLLMIVLSCLGWFSLLVY